MVDSQGRSYWSASGKASTDASSGAGSGAAPNRQDVIAGLESPTPYTGELSRDDAVPKKPVAAMSYGQRVRIARLYDSYQEFIGKDIKVAGWARSTRSSGKAFCFVELNDGSCFKTIQVVVD